MPHLTDALVRQLPKPAGSTRITYDDKVIGFGVRVTPAGARTFLLRFRNAQGVERKMRIGAFPAWTTAAARAEASRLQREAVNVGVDPLAERKAAREAATVDDVLTAYQDSARFKDKADLTRASDEGRIKRHLRPLLGKRLVHELRLGDIEKAFADIRDGKTRADVKTGKRGRAIVKGGEGVARKSIRLLSAAFAWAVREEMIAANPALGVEVGADEVRDVILDDAGYKAMFEALDRLEAENVIGTAVADVIRLLALTGARRSELVRLPRSYYDPSRGLIIRPVSRHKTGKKTGQPRVIGLPQEAQAILNRQPAGDVLFDFDPSVVSKAWLTVRAVAKLPAGIGLHGLRHSLASHLAMGGASAAEIMIAVGHRQMSTSQRYIHFAQNARVGLAERAAAVALGAMKKPSEA